MMKELNNYKEDVKMNSVPDNKRTEKVTVEDYYKDTLYTESEDGQYTAVVDLTLAMKEEAASEGLKQYLTNAHRCLGDIGISNRAIERKQDSLTSLVWMFGFLHFIFLMLIHWFQ